VVASPVVALEEVLVASLVEALVEELEDALVEELEEAVVTADVPALVVADVEAAVPRIDPAALLMEVPVMVGAIVVAMPMPMLAVALAAVVVVVVAVTGVEAVVVVSAALFAEVPVILGETVAMPSMSLASSSSPPEGDMVVAMDDMLSIMLSIVVPLAMAGVSMVKLALLLSLVVGML